MLGILLFSCALPNTRAKCDSLHKAHTMNLYIYGFDILALKFNIITLKVLPS